MGRGAVLVGAVLTVLVAGCGSSEVMADPATSASTDPSWTAVPRSPLSARHGAEGVWVGGRFVVVGGWGGPPCPANASCVAPPLPALRDGAAFDPVARRWERIAGAPVPVNGSSAVAAGGRMYLLAPDQGGRGLLGYDPDADTWTTYPAPPQPGQLVALGASVAVIPNSDELRPAVDAVFDPGRGSWRRLPADPLGPSFGRDAVAVDGELLLAAHDLVPNPGSKRPSLVRLARLDSGLTRWKKLADSEILGGGMVVAGDRVVWSSTGSADGGEVNGWGRSYPEGGIYDPATDAWSPLPEYPDAAPGRWCCSGAVLGGAVLGGDEARVLVRDRLLDPVSRHWSSLPRMPGQERVSAAVISGPDALLVWGGALDGSRPANLADGYLLVAGYR